MPKLKSKENTADLNSSQGASLPLLSLIVLFIFLAASIYLSFLTRQEISRRSQILFEAEANKIQQHILKQMEMYVHGLLGPQALFAASKSVERDEWRAFFKAMQISENYPGVSSLRFNERVTAANKEAFINQVRGDVSINPGGYPDFKIFPESDSPEYYVVKYAEPDKNLAQAIGFDLRSDSDRTKIIEQVWDSGEVFMTRVTERAELSGQLGFSIHAPVYFNNTKVDTVEDRRANSQGTVSLLINVSELFSDILSRGTFSPEVGFQITDLEGEQVVYQNAAFDKFRQNSSHYSLRYNVDFPINNRQWKIIFHGHDGFGLSALEKNSPKFIFLVSVLLGLLVSAVIFALLTSRHRALGLARQMTQELRESEKMFRTLANFAPVGIFLTDKDGGCEFVNDKWTEYAGIRMENALGTEWAKALYPQDRSRIFNAWMTCVRNNENFSQEYRFQTPRGKVTWLTGSAIPLRNEAGAVTGYIGTITDITERIHNEKELMEKEERLRLAMSSANMGLWEWSIRDSRVIWSTEKDFSSALFSDQTQNTYEKFLHRVHPDDRRGFEESLRKAVADSEYFYHELRANNIQGKFSWMSISARVYWEDGKAVRVSGMIQNITDRKMLQDEMIKFEKAKTVELLAAGAAHEVKNPLAIILQGVQYLQDRMIKAGDPLVTETLDDIVAAVHRANTIVKSMMNLARPTEMVFKPSDINAVIEQSVNFLDQQIKQKQIKTKLDLTKELPLLSLDSEKIGEVLINLLMNAVDAMGPGGALTVKTRSESKDLAEGGGLGTRNKTVFVEIEDSGPGIPADVLHNIFEPFFTTKRATGGTGLGLTIVRHLVKMHNGDINIANRQEGGVRVTMMFPVH